MNKTKVLIAIAITAVMLVSAFAIAFGSEAYSVSQTPQSGLLSNLSPATGHGKLDTSTNTPWTYPTNTYQEPGYTNGTFKMGINCNVNTLNYFPANTYCDVYVLDEIYDGMYNTLPNGTTIPWLATGYSVQVVNGTTFDILSNSTANYTAIYTVNLRPYVQWTDWSQANASQTYTFSNYTWWYNAGNITSHTYKSYSNTTMKTYYLQSADVVLSWRLENGAFGIWPNVVNVIPNGNLSVKIFVSKQTLLLVPDVFTNDILPYHIWKNHDFTTIPGLFNCSPSLSSTEGYYQWNLGWNSATGAVPGLVGTGPFMVTNNYGIPDGQIIPSQVETLYANPHYFVQYANASSGLRQYTPKFYEIYQPFYTSESALVAAYQKGLVDTTSLAPPPSFLPQLKSTPGGTIYKKLSSSYGYFRLDTNVAPLNITAFRQALNYATPTSYMASVIADGFGVLSSNPVNPGNTLFVNSSAPQYTFDMAKAAQLIASIPGMVNTSSGLTYLGKPVSITVDTTVGSIAPNNIEDIESAFTDWNALGIKTVLKQESFTTLTAVVDGTIAATNFTNINDIHSSSPLYTAEVEGISTASGNPSLGCQEFLNPVYGVPTNEYVGPFSSLNVSGHMLTGGQVQMLFDNLTSQMVSSNNISVVYHDAKYLQTLQIEEAYMINIGYGEDLVPLQTNGWANYSLSNTEAQYLYWYWQFFSIYATQSTITPPSKSLSVSYILDSGSTFTAGTYGNITFTVKNGTSPASGANLAVGFAAQYGGLLNVSSNSLVANASGQATWEYHVEPYLAQVMTQYNSSGEPVSVTDQSISITAVASYQGQTAIGPGAASASIAVINGPALHVTYAFNQTSYTAGESGTVTFTVTQNNSAYSGEVSVEVNLTTAGYIDLGTYAGATSLVLQTNSQGIAVFNFVTVSNLTSAVIGAGLFNVTFTPANPAVYGDSVTVIAPLVVSHVTTHPTTPTQPVNATKTNLLPYYAIIGLLVAVVVILAVMVAVTRKNVKPKQ
jgi:hypothetical protein